MAVLVLKDVERRFGDGDNKLQVLNGVNLSVEQGEMVALLGPSGSGKSTLLYITGLLDRPDAGSVQVANIACEKMNDRERTFMRSSYLGFVYQSHLLMPDFTALENVMIPQLIASRGRKESKEYAFHLLEKMGLAERASHRPGELSGGEQQRVAIARALANRPQLLLADEPTGNLDPATSEKVFLELLTWVKEEHVSALIATHNPTLADKMHRRVRLENGKIVEEK